MSLLKGKAIVKNVAGITLTAGIVSGTNAAEFQSFKGATSGDIKETLDTNGNMVTAYVHNSKKTVTLTVVPSGANIAAAQASLAAWVGLARGTLVTVADADTTYWDGSYILMSANDSRGNTDPATVEIELMNGVENDISATAT